MVSSSRAFGLQEDLVAAAVGEADDLVLDRRAVARADALDLAGIHGRAIEVPPDELVGRRGRGGDAAGDLRRGDAVGQIGERNRRVVARLHLQAGPVDRAAVEPRRRPGLETTEREAEPAQGGREAERGRLADAAGGDLLLADMDETAQEGAGRYDDRAARRRSPRPSVLTPRTWPESSRSISSAPPARIVRFGCSARIAWTAWR